ncbi:hypothetical protein [Cellulomonas cellasea]|uniref:Uncharacterized protein n=1 Tax=Cellulomonas cellasea TaxID=43670 RepID=A0A4Y3KVD1_9CELL|nr:hypothetical protein [Cellulomonas cellasea]GEA87807.1 hypothetical protein CCE01nite_17560 [Cellulomonas cellasea]
MSSFVVSDDHIDYLVTAALVHVPDHPAVVSREPAELGRLLLRENVGTVTDRYLGWGEEDLDDDEREELEGYASRVAGYVFRPVSEVDAAQGGAGRPVLAVSARA